MADYEQMMRDLMQVYSSGASLEDLRYDQPYRSKDPGTKYRSGEVTSDVGLLDPVDMLAGMLASKGATLARQGVQALKPRPGVPRTGGRGLMRSERGSTGGGSWWDEADDVPFPSGHDLPADQDPRYLRQMQALRDMREAERQGLETQGVFKQAYPARPASPPPAPPSPRRPAGARPAPKPDAASGQMAEAIARSKERVGAVMDEHVAMHGEYNPDLHESMYEDLNPFDGESLMDYVQRLIQLEERYNADAFYGKGQFPPSTIEAISKTLAPERASNIAAEAFANPTKRTVDMATGQPIYADLPPLFGEAGDVTQPSRANEYADIIRKLFEREGQ